MSQERQMKLPADGEKRGVPIGYTPLGVKYRVQLDFEPKDFHEISALVEELKVGTYAELMRSALRTLRWMARRTKSGSTVAAMASDGTMVAPQFDFLQSIVPHPEKPKPNQPARPSVRTRRSRISTIENSL